MAQSVSTRSRREAACRRGDIALAATTSSHQDQAAVLCVAPPDSELPNIGRPVRRAEGLIRSLSVQRSPRRRPLRCQDSAPSTPAYGLQYIVGPAKFVFANRTSFPQLGVIDGAEAAAKHVTRRRWLESRHDGWPECAGPSLLTAPFAAGAKKPARCPAGRWRAAASAGCSRLHS